MDTEVLPSPGYIPALSYDWLTGLYDPIMRWSFPEQRLKRLLVDAIGSPATVLDLGCGTGTLALMLHDAHPQARIIGMDVDGAILAIAFRKTQQVELDRLALMQASAPLIPLEGASLDVVVSSLVIHHLTTENKRAAFQECFRALRPGGLLFIADFAPPRSRYAHAVSLVMRYLEEVGDNLRGRLPEMIEQAGFVDVQPFAHLESLLGTITILRALRPAPISN